MRARALTCFAGALCAALLPTSTLAAPDTLGPYPPPADAVAPAAESSLVPRAPEPAIEVTKAEAEPAAVPAAPFVQPSPPAAKVVEHVDQQPLGVPAPPSRESMPLPAASARSPFGGGNITRTAVSLGIVVGLIVLLGTLYKKFGARAHGSSLLQSGKNRRPGSGAPSGIVEVLGRYPLDAGLTLVLLKVDRRVLLLSQSGSLGVAKFFGRRGAGSSGQASLSTLAEFAEPADVASILSRVSEAEGSSMNARFRQLVERFGHEHDGAEPIGDVHTTGRLVRTNDEGDRAELLDERSLVIPSTYRPRGAHATGEVEIPETPTTYAFRAPHTGGPTIRANTPAPARRTPQEPDAVASLKRRLESMRTGIGGGGR